MQFKMSKLSWVLLIALFSLNMLVSSGRVSGTLADIARIALAITAIGGIIRDWMLHRRQRDHG